MLGLSARVARDVEGLSARVARDVQGLSARVACESSELWEREKRLKAIHNKMHWDTV